jgi:2-polyprenyl-3-methyl-5-hydroxy-6-metoxy-1,4-benzoquinol methylase
MNSLKIFSSSTEKESLGYKFRRKRFSFFLKNIEVLCREKEKNNTLPLKILDVGGLQSYWENMGMHNNSNLNITLVNLISEVSHYENISAIEGDATNLHTIKDNEYDVVFSNSVIEHVYSYESQEKMSAEVKRVGRYHFIQTPNRNFFLEPHYLLPFFQYLPKQTQFFLLTKTILSRGHKWDKKFAQQYVEEIRLITLKEMKTLFSESKIYKEKFLGLTKSFTAHNF